MVTGCNDKETNYTFNESEYYSNEQLASISSDNDSLFWIGTEYGKVCQLTDSGWKSFHVAADRIYFVRHTDKLLCLQRLTHGDKSDAALRRLHASGRMANHRGVFHSLQGKSWYDNNWIVYL